MLKRVLAVDDDDMNLMRIKKILRTEYDVFFASSGVEALDTILTTSSSWPDAVRKITGVSGANSFMRSKVSKRKAMRAEEQTSRHLLLAVITTTFSGMLVMDAEEKELCQHQSDAQVFIKRVGANLGDVQQPHAETADHHQRDGHGFGAFGYRDAENERLRDL